MLKPLITPFLSIIKGGPNLIDSLPVLHTKSPFFKHFRETLSAISLPENLLYFLKMTDAINPFPKQSKMI